MVKLDSLTVCWQVANIVLKEFAGHPKVYIWNGEGKTQKTSTRLFCILCFVLKIVELVIFSFLQNLTLTWDILHGLMLLS